MVESVHRPPGLRHRPPPARWLVVLEGIAALLALVMLVGGAAAAVTWAVLRAVQMLTS
jgi:hypothetical protein